MSHKRHPLEIPEIVRLVGCFVEESSLLPAMKVSETFHEQVAVTAWQTIVVDFKNKALYSHLPSYTDEEEEDPRLLPWESLRKYGRHVRNIEMTSYMDKYLDDCEPSSCYSRPTSVADLLTTLGKLSLLKCITLDINCVNLTDLRLLFKLISRSCIKSLKIKRCDMDIRGMVNDEHDLTDSIWAAQASAHIFEYNVEELVISSGSEIGLWGFLSRSPRLRVLSIYGSTRSNSCEAKGLNELVTAFRKKGLMPCLQHVDICISRRNSHMIPRVVNSVRRLRSFQCHNQDALLSPEDFRPHFSTLTTIDVWSGTPEFWQEVMLSCPALVTAKEVVLFAEDIIGREEWASTGLESLDVNVFVRTNPSEGSSREIEENVLFRRIAKLVKLKHLSVHTGWRETRTLYDQNWKILLGIKTLASVEFGRELMELEDRLNVPKRLSEKQIKFDWSEAKMLLWPEIYEEDVDRVHGEDAALIQALIAKCGAIQN